MNGVGPYFVHSNFVRVWFGPTPLHKIKILKTTWFTKYEQVYMYLPNSRDGRFAGGGAQEPIFSRSKLFKNS